MALRNVLSKITSVLTANGQILAGGKVYLYEPGGNKTDNAIATYSDSALTTANTNPVRLSGSGRAEIWINRDADMRIEDRNDQLIFTLLNVNPDEVDTAAAGGLILNGGFEDDTDANNVPDNWTLVSESGSTNALITSESTEGEKSFRFISTGSGGGSLTTTDFFAVNETDDLKVTLDYRSTVAGVRNIVRVEWYNSAKASISNSDVLDEAVSNPTSFTSQSLTATPPANSRFAKLKLIGCDPSNSTVGNTIFDNVRVFYPTTIDGAVGNLLLAGNTISSTNSNGDINLTPNGTGEVVLQGNGDDTVRVEGDGVLTIKGDTTSSDDQRLLVFKDSADTIKGFLGHNSADAVTLKNSNTSGQIWLLGNDSGGSATFLFSGNPDGKASIFHDGVEVLKTVAGSDGGVEIRNEKTGNSAEYTRVLTTADQLSKVLTTNAVFTSTTTVADTALEIQNIPLGYYQFEAHIVFSCTTTGSQGIRVDFIATGGGASNTFLNNAVGVRRTSQGQFSTSVEAADQEPGSDYTATLSAAGVSAMLISGVIQITTAGDWTCRAAQAVSSANDTTLIAGSFMKLTPLTQ